MGWLNINGNWIGRHSGKSVSSYWTQQNILQKLDFSMDADKKLLLDISGAGNNAQLVNSNCLYTATTSATVSISATPVVSGYKCFDFSVEFSLKYDSSGGYQLIIGRAGLYASGFKNFYSCFQISNGDLNYYSGNGTTNSVTKLATLVNATVYVVKVSINNTTGRIDWTINGVAGGANFTNYTPETDQSGEVYGIGIGAQASWFFKGKLWDVKYYSGLNFSSLQNHYPFSEGYGVLAYDCVGSANIVVTNTANWSTQDEYHYNITNGFQLYGNSDTASRLIRVPYKNNGTKIDPTIAGYVKFDDCNAGLFHNFAETGVKRNYLDNADLTAAGVANTHVLYYGGLCGSSGYAFCRNHMGLETEYTLFSEAETLTTYRKTYFGYREFSYFMDDKVTKVLIAGTTGRIHNTNIKYAANVTGTSSIYYDCFVRNGTFTLTDSTTQLQILISNYCGLIGESKEGVIINAELAPNTAKTTISNTSLLATAGNYRIACLTGTVKNMRYVLHDDSNVDDAVKRIDKVSLTHYGNVDAIALDPTVYNTTNAYGGGVYEGTDIEICDSYFKGYLHGSGYGEGIIIHASEIETEPVNSKFTNCEFDSNGDYVFNWRTYPSGQNDSITTQGCNFNNKKIQLYCNTLTYDPHADKIHLYKNTSDIAPEIYATLPIYIGLKISTGITKTLTINTGAVKILLFGTEKTINTYSLVGRVNITTYYLATGFVGLKGLLGDCSGTSKVLSVKLDGVDTDITFDQDYSAMTNVQVLASINGINADVQFAEYDFSVNAAFINL